MKNRQIKNVEECQSLPAFVLGGNKAPMISLPFCDVRMVSQTGGRTKMTKYLQKIRFIFPFHIKYISCEKGTWS